MCAWRAPSDAKSRKLIPIFSLAVALETAFWKADSPELKETVSLAEIQNHAEHVMEVRGGSPCLKDSCRDY